MTLIPTSNGVPYLPDGFPLDKPSPSSVWTRALIFALVFVVLQVMWEWARGTGIERVVIDTMTVEPAVFLLNLFSPDVHAVADGTRIRAPGGGINILNGCEGTEVLFMMIAAFCAVPMVWRRRVQGLVISVGLVYALNQVRILCLFYAFRGNKSLFDLLHTVLAPLMLIIFSALFFSAWIHRDLGTTEAA